MVAINERLQTVALAPSCRCGFFHLGQEAGESQGRSIGVALLLLTGLFITELAVSYWSHSLSLLADAGHLLADGLSLGLTLTAVLLSRRPAQGQATFGHRRMEVLAALVNGLSLLVIATWVAGEGWERWQSPQEVLGLPMLVGACLGLLVNGVNLILLYRSSRDDLNLRSLLLHVFVDASSSLGLLVASLTIHFWHWFWMDTITSVVVAVLAVAVALPLIRQSLEILLEYAPHDLDPAVISQTMLAFDEVLQVEALRLWTITAGQTALSARLQIKASLQASDRDWLLHQLQGQLEREFGIQEIVLQLRADLPRAAAAELKPLFNNNLLTCIHSKAS